jgi:histidinol-phosphate aminotransferase
MADVAKKLHRYPSADHNDLKEALAKLHGLNADNLICSNGSDEVIGLLCQAYAGEGDEVLHTEHGFAMYPICARTNGAVPVAVPEANRHTDVDALLAGITERTRLVFVANPNNPTGTMISEAEICRLADGVPENCLLVLDGAYAEYVEGFDAGARLVVERENVVMTRTFSKIYGLGGLRLGKKAGYT